jgi:hypothetical protein
VFGPLAKAYKSRIREHSLFGAERITNNQFLSHYQHAREKAITVSNISSAWRATGLIPYDPTPILQKFRPKTPPQASLIDENGRRINITITEPSLASKVNELIAQIVEVCPTPYHSNIHTLGETCLTAIADANTLRFVNETIVKKQQQSRCKRTKKHFGSTRILTVAEAQQRQQEQASNELQLQGEKERAAALRGKVGFAKLVWKEFKMDVDIFNC